MNFAQGLNRILRTRAQIEQCEFGLDNLEKKKVGTDCALRTKCGSMDREARI